MIDSLNELALEDIAVSKEGFGAIGEEGLAPVELMGEFVVAGDLDSGE